jgi:hypothetical protein
MEVKKKIHPRDQHKANYEEKRQTYDYVEVQVEGNKGKGLKVKKDAMKGVKIDRFIGWLIQTFDEELMQATPNGGACKHTKALGSGWYIDGCQFAVHGAQLANTVLYGGTGKGQTLKNCKLQQEGKEERQVVYCTTTRAMQEGEWVAVDYHSQVEACQRKECRDGCTREEDDGPAYKPTRKMNAQEGTKKTYNMRNRIPGIAYNEND